MTPIRKAALKTATVFVGAFVLLIALAEVLGLNHLIFGSVLFNPEFYASPGWLYLSSRITPASATLTGILGYVIAKRKNRNAHNWAGLCFFFNIWGVISLSFLPSSEAEPK